MDRAKLEEAIAYLIGRDGSISGAHSREGGNYVKCLTMLGVLKEAAEAHLATLPKPTKMVEVWRCEWVQYEIPKPFSQSEGSGEASKKWAEDHANYLRNYSCYSCIRVTGPHQQEVPA